MGMCCTHDWRIRYGGAAGGLRHAQSFSVVMGFFLCLAEARGESPCIYSRAHSVVRMRSASRNLRFVIVWD